MTSWAVHPQDRQTVTTPNSLPAAAKTIESNLDRLRVERVESKSRRERRGKQKKAKPIAERVFRVNAKRKLESDQLPLRSRAIF